APHGPVNASPLIVTFLSDRFVTADSSGLGPVVLRSIFSIVTFSITFPLFPRIDPRLEHEPFTFWMVTLRTEELGGGLPWRSNYCVHGATEITLPVPSSVMSLM